MLGWFLSNFTLAGGQAGGRADVKSIPLSGGSLVFLLLLVFPLSALVGVWLCGAGQQGQGGTLRCQPEGQPTAGGQPPTSYHSGFLWEDEPLGPGLHPGPLSTEVLRWERWLAATGVLQLCGMQAKARGGRDPGAGEATDTQGDMSRDRKSVV